MQRRELVKILLDAGFLYKHGGNHDVFFKGALGIPVKRHREIEDQVAKKNLETGRTEVDVVGHGLV